MLHPPKTTLPESYISSKTEMPNYGLYGMILSAWQKRTASYEKTSFLLSK
jgi:hypothetical protein